MKLVQKIVDADADADADADVDADFYFEKSKKKKRMCKKTFLENFLLMFNEIAISIQTLLLPFCYVFVEIYIADT